MGYLLAGLVGALVALCVARAIEAMNDPVDLDL